MSSSNSVNQTGSRPTNTTLLHLDVSIADDQTANQSVGMFWDKPEAYAVPVMFAIIFVVGLVGNGTLIYSVVRNKSMRNTPNVFIVSLAVGDMLLILVSVPVAATIYTLTEWHFGVTMCRLNEFLRTLSLGVSIFTLTALSGDRFCAIVFPMRQHRVALGTRTYVIAAVIWLLAIVFAIPEAVLARVSHQSYGGGRKLRVCDVSPPEMGEEYPKVRVVFRFVVYFAIPMCIILVFYALMARALVLSSRHLPGGNAECQQARKQLEARKKVAKVVLSFVVVFVVCWLPRHVYLLWYRFDTGQYNMFWHVFKIVGFCLSFINSCLNPFALYFLSKQFRRYYNRYLFCCCTSDRLGVNSQAPVRMNTYSSSRMVIGHHNSTKTASTTIYVNSN